MNKPQLQLPPAKLYETMDHGPDAFLGTFSHPSEAATRALIDGKARFGPVFKIEGDNYRLIAISIIYDRPSPANPDAIIPQAP